MYFFGCLSKEEPGHYFYNEKMIGVRPPDLLTNEIDGKFCTKDQREENFGIPTLHEYKDYTIIAFWDREGDSCPGSNSAFVLKRHLSIDQMIALARDKFPMQAMRMDVK